MIAPAQRRDSRRLFGRLAALTLLLLAAGAFVGSEGLSLGLLHDPGLLPVLRDIRAPRTLGAWGVGALLGLAGAIAQGLFRNPLADPYLLGSAAGAGLGVVLVLAGAALAGAGLPLLATDLAAHLGLTGAAFGGALLGVTLTLSLARGVQRSTGLLLAGVVVGVVLNAITEVLTLAAPETLRGRQMFVLGTTGFLGWGSCATLALALAATLPPAVWCSRALDALTLGEDSARSLGLDLARWRRVLVVLMALATGAAVAQAGLVAFVGLVAPQLVRRRLQAPHGVTLAASAAAGGALLLASDLLARSVIAPEELPVGVLTAALGGAYLLAMLRRGWR